MAVSWAAVAVSPGLVVGRDGRVAGRDGRVAGRDGRVAGAGSRAWLAVSRHSAQPHALSLLPPVAIHYMYCDTIPCLASFSLSQYTQCIVTQYLKPTSGHNTLLCIAIQSFLSHQPPIAIQFFQPLHTHYRLCHNTIPNCIVTQLGSSPTNFLHLFFFFFTHKFFFFTRFCYWKIPKNMYLYFFSHFPEHQINL